jgi:hypothetical protein
VLTSTRRGIVYPNTTRVDTADVPRDIAALVAALEIDVIYGQGPIASRPTSTSGSPGIQGRIYVSTDENPKTMYYDYGTGWQSIGAIAAGGIGTVQLADVGVTTAKLADLGVTSGKLADLAVITAKINDGAVTAVKISNTLKPSAGAGGGVEALRALGTAAGTAAPGTHAPQHLPSGADPLVVAYGTALPTSALFNGYEFRLFINDPVAGQIMLDCVYRADLDGTYPWHVSSIPTTIYGQNSVHTTAAENVIATVVTFTAPRTGVYGYLYSSSATSNGSAAVHRININGSAGGWLPATQPFGGRVTLSATQTVIVQHSNDFSNINLSDTAETGVWLSYPQKIV